MSLSFLIHSLFLSVAILLSFIWVKNPNLSIYTLQLVGLFILLYFVLGRLKNLKQPVDKTGQLVTSIIFTMVVMLLVFSTGGINSPLFFLTYFLLFGLSLTLDPNITVVLSLLLMLFLFLHHPTNTLDNLLPIFSLILITPLSIFFGKEYLKVLQYRGKIKILQKEVKKTAANITSEETNVLLWLSLNFKHSLQTIIDKLSQTLERPGLNFSQKQLLLKALNEAKKLIKSGQELEEKVDKQTDTK